MTKEHLKKLIDKYQFAEKQISDLDMNYGICLWNSSRENFYNAYNYIIFDLFGQLYGEQNKQLLEDFIFQQTDMTFDELYEAINE